MVSAAIVAGLVRGKSVSDDGLTVPISRVLSICGKTEPNQPKNGYLELLRSTGLVVPLLATRLPISLLTPADGLDLYAH